MTLFGEVEKPDLLITGGFCPGIDLLEDLSGLRFRTLYTGSSGGFSAIAAKTADIAGVNMPSRHSDGQAGIVYNVPTIERMGLSEYCTCERVQKGYRAYCQAEQHDLRTFGPSGKAPGKPEPRFRHKSSS